MQTFGIGFSWRRRSGKNHVGHQIRRTGIAADDAHHNVPDVDFASDDFFDFTEFYPIATDFDLSVASPKKFYFPIFGVAPQVSSTIKTAVFMSRAERVWEETFRSQIWAVDIAFCDAGATYADLSCLGSMDRHKPVI